MVRRCAYDVDGGAPAVRAFAVSTACGRETALPARTTSTIYFQPSAFMGNRTDFCIDLFAFTIRSPAWETAPISVSNCSPSQFAHLHGKPHRFRVSDTEVVITRTEIGPFRLQGTHVIPILFGSQFTIDVRLHDLHRFFWGGGAKLERNRTWETSLAFFFISTAALLTVRSRFFFAAEHRRTRAISERHHARATSEFTGWRSSLPFFFYVVWFHMVYTRL